MKIRLTKEIIEAFPGISVHALVFDGLRNERKISTVSQLLRGVVAEKKRELKDEEKKKKIMGFIKNTGVDNKTLREAQLLKASLNKIGLGRDVKPENPLKDLAHYLALKYVVPVLGNDLDQAFRDIEIGFTVTRQGKRAEDLDYLPETKKAVIWLVDIGSMPKEDFAKLPEEFKKVIIKYCRGNLEAEYTLDAGTPEADLQYVSQKEIEYADEQKRLAEEKAFTDKILGSDQPPFLASGEGGGEGGASGGGRALLSAPQKPAVERLAEAVKEATEKYLAENNLVVDKAADPDGLDFEMETPHDPVNGDYASPAAMKLAKTAGRPPREVAEGLIKLLPTLDFVEKTEIAGPGFINFHLSTAHLVKELDLINEFKADFGKTALGKGKKVVIEYSQPNIAKPLGVHHLLSTIIGQTLVNIYRFAGFDVKAINYPGDWGTQFGKLLYAYKNWGSEEVVKKDPLNELLKLYVRFHDEAEKDPAMDDLGRAEFKKLEEGDEENKKLWEWFKDLSLKEIERLYAILGVKFDEYLGEAMYAEAGREVIKEGLEKGLIEVGEKDALIVKFENEKYPPFMIRKADGATLYSTRDLASIKDRLVRYDHPDKIVYVVDVAQSLHFKQLFETARMFGYVGGDGDATELIHVVFGRMQLPEGRMSTRKGDVILLDEVIREAVSRTEKLIAEKSADLPAEEREKVAREMAVSSIKYNIISQNRETNITFDWDRMLSLDGNSGPYLEYAFARAQSILKKAMEQAAEKNRQTAALAAGAAGGTATSAKSGGTVVPDAPKKPEKPLPKPKNKNQTDLFSLAEEMLMEEEMPSFGGKTTPGADSVSGPGAAPAAESKGNAAIYVELPPLAPETPITTMPAPATTAVTAPTEPSPRHAEDAKAVPFGHEAEKRLLRMLPRFQEFVEAAVRDYKPNHLTTYLFDLARAFNSFYNEVPVLNASREDLKNSRLKLVKATATVLQNGLKVLGVSVFERM
jgi:arginyl-tRNA synthetase